MFDRIVSESSTSVVSSRRKVFYVLHHLDREENDHDLRPTLVSRPVLTILRVSLNLRHLEAKTIRSYLVGEKVNGWINIEILNYEN